MSLGMLDPCSHSGPQWTTWLRLRSGLKWFLAWSLWCPSPGNGAGSSVRPSRMTKHYPPAHVTRLSSGTPQQRDWEHGVDMEHGLGVRAGVDGQ